MSGIGPISGVGIYDLLNAGAKIRYGKLMLATSPVNYWRLGDASGTTAVDEMGVNNGTYVGTPTLGAAGLLYGDPNPAVTLNGTQYVTATSNDVSGTNPFTLAAWVNFTPSGYQMFISNPVTSGGYGAEIIDGLSGPFIRRVNSAGEDAAPASGSQVQLSAGVTHLVVGTYDGTSLRLYVDGLLEGSPVASSRVLPAVSTGVFHIGADAANGSKLTGTLDEGAYWDRALTAAEIADLYLVGSGT